MVALRAGLLEMVRASIVGALLANLLAALGLSFLLGGLGYHTQEHNPQAVRAYSSTMVLAWISLALRAHSTAPSAQSRTKPSTRPSI
jgi:Ca2+:H+ antiporter